MEKTYVMLKPDTIKRKLIGKLISRIEDKGFSIIKMELMTPDREVFEEHYAHVPEKFKEETIDFMTSGPVIGMVVEGENVIECVRTIMGKTKWFEALPGTIRGDYANETTANLIHGSDSKENAEIEINRFFGNNTKIKRF